MTFLNDNEVSYKIGGSHTTIIGDRLGKKVVRIVVSHPDVKKIIPSVIRVKNKSPGGFSAKVLRPDARGNLRLLLTEGTSFQELRIVTRLPSANEGFLLSEELNTMIHNFLKR